jgi:hypothetical protein
VATAETKPSEKPKTNTGRIEEIQGVVIEATFPNGELPEIYNAITIDRGEQETLVCEVQQHLGDDRVRAVAMDSTDGLARGMEVVDTGGPITVPVGDGTLGRIFNLLGDPIDEGGEVKTDERWPIHRPAYANAREIAEELMAHYVDGDIDRVEVFYNGYVSALTQEVRRETLLPLQQATILEGTERDREGAEDAPGHRALVDYEPDPKEILARLVPDYVEISVYRALLESTASEHGARMTAMRNASENAGERASSASADDADEETADEPEKEAAPA